MCIYYVQVYVESTLSLSTGNMFAKYNTMQYINFIASNIQECLKQLIYMYVTAGQINIFILQKALVLTLLQITHGLRQLDRFKA